MSECGIEHGSVAAVQVFGANHDSRNVVAPPSFKRQLDQSVRRSRTIAREESTADFLFAHRIAQPVAAQQEDIAIGDFHDLFIEVQRVDGADRPSHPVLSWAMNGVLGGDMASGPEFFYLAVIARQLP
jgi:hypothetical protein